MTEEIVEFLHLEKKRCIEGFKRPYNTPKVFQKFYFKTILHHLPCKEAKTQPHYSPSYKTPTTTVIFI